MKLLDPIYKTLEFVDYDDAFKFPEGCDVVYVHIDNINKNGEISLRDFNTWHVFDKGVLRDDKETFIKYVFAKIYEPEIINGINPAIEDEDELEIDTHNINLEDAAPL